MPVEAPVASEVTCIRCGRPMPAETYWCPSCGKLNATLRARVLFFAMFVAIFLGIAVTSRYVAYLKRFEASLGERWYGRGEQAMNLQQFAAAIKDYRNALAYEGGNSQYRLRLAEALMAADRYSEARSYLLSLWSRMPADGEINLQLARIYSREGDADLAVRYYRMAIDGVWNSAAVERRTETRVELVQYFLQKHDRARAAAELIALQAEAPDNPAIQMQAAHLLLEVGDNQRAAKAFQAVVNLNPRDAEAWTGAGEAALAAGDYHNAVHALSTASKLTSSKPGSAEEDRLELAREVYSADPGLRSLTLAERANRVAANFEAAMKWLERCSGNEDILLRPTAPADAGDAGTTAAPSEQTKQQSFAGSVLPSIRGVPESLHSLYQRELRRGSGATEAPSKTDPQAIVAPGSLQLLYQSGLQRRRSASAEALRHDPDSMVPTMEFVYQATRALENACPPDTIRARALQLLASHENEELR